MAKQIVSANYLDRESSKKWLIRSEEQGIEGAQAFESVEATGVVFTASSADEEGFGCSMVAVCDTAVGSSQPSKREPKYGKRLRFDGFDFVDKKGDVVERCNCLVLNADGSMLTYD